MGKFVDFVASHERKRKVRMICSSWPEERPNNEKRKKRPFVSSSTISVPIGANVKITKSRVLKRMSKNDSVLHKVCWSLSFYDLELSVVIGTLTPSVLYLC